MVLKERSEVKGPAGRQEPFEDMAGAFVQFDFDEGGVKHVYGVAPLGAPRRRKARVEVQGDIQRFGGGANPPHSLSPLKLGDHVALKAGGTSHIQGQP